MTGAEVLPWKLVKTLEVIVTITVNHAAVLTAEEMPKPNKKVIQSI